MLVGDQRYESTEGFPLATITLESVSRRVGRDRILDHVDLVVADGECVSLLGRSGSGKSSVLRVVAGLDSATSGRVLFDGVDMVDVAVADRDVAMTFQDTTLFPRLTARRNVAFPLNIRKRPLEEIRDRVTAESRALDIEHLLERFPDQLSDGHQQLVQIARALVRVPQVFLLDEPLARLDPATRTHIRNEIKLLQAGYGVTMLYATNDPAEALAIADRVAVIEAGHLIQIDRPQALRRNPVNRSTAVLTGPISFIDATVEAASAGFWLDTAGLRVRAWPPVLAQHVGSRVVMGIRPDAVRVDPSGSTRATLGRFTFHGAKPGRELHIGPHTIAAHLGAEGAEGDSIIVAFDQWQVFDQAGEAICTIG